MLKKIISLMIIFAMLVPFSSAIAADEPAPQPTIEEILKGYHEKLLPPKPKKSTPVRPPGPAAAPAVPKLWKRKQ